MSLDSPEFKPHSELMRVSRFAIVTAAYNASIVERLYESARAVLLEHAVPEHAIERHRVPGSNELPYVMHMLALTGEYDCLIALGVVIAGDTKHHEMIEITTANAIQRIGMVTEVPCINGIITTETREQAENRAGERINRGREFAMAAMCMAEHKHQLIERLDQLDIQDRARRSTMENN